MQNQNSIEAYPRNPQELATLPSCPEVLVEAKRRGVKNVVHFTTKSGALGVLAARSVKSRKRLPHDRYLECVYQPNVATRKDPEWIDYVNLSVERINDWMFSASRRWHVEHDNSWVALSFHPRILAHPGVVFATTNNIYSGCTRAEGLTGFRRLYQDTIWRGFGSVQDRANKQPSWPTDRQAEVLYPGELSCKHLQQIDVQCASVIDDIHGMLSALHLDSTHTLDIAVCHAPEVFQ